MNGRSVEAGSLLAQEQLATDRRARLWVALALLAGLPALVLAACSVKSTTRLPDEQVLPLLEATLPELLARIREQHESVRSLNARASLVPSTGSAYSGVIEEYTEVQAFVLAERLPAGETGLPTAAGPQTQIRVIGQAPVVRKNVFDMVADDREFRIHVPSQNKFVIGPSALERRSEKPIENLRPQHLIEALFVEPPAAGATHLREENESGGMRYWVVTELETESGALRLRRKWWFRRTNLALARAQRFGSAGELVSDVHYDVWTQHGALRYPHSIVLLRLQDDYGLELHFEKVALNENLEPERFRLEQPAGTELVDLSATAAKPAATAPPPEPRP